MLGTMAKRRKKSRASAWADEPLIHRKVVLVGKSLQDAIVRCSEMPPFGADESVIMRQALMEYLTKRGFWPPKGEAEDDG